MAQIFDTQKEPSTMHPQTAFWLTVIAALAVGFALWAADDAQAICEANGNSAATCFQQLNR